MTLLEHTVDFLKQYGYLPKSYKPTKAGFEDVAITSAIAKFQRFDANVKRLKEETGEPLLEDGVPGGATLLAMQLPRCACEDPIEEPAIGSGGWSECIEPDEHGAIVEVDQSNLPSFLKPVFQAVLSNVQKSYAEIGLLFVFRDKSTKEDLIVGGPVDGRTQTDLTFTRGSGWIGLALVGPFSCGRKAWLKLHYGYQPRNVAREWTTLIKHELGHNCGLRHSSGGVMNPSIVGGLPVSWRGDPSHSTLVRWFGGEPVDIPGGDEPEPPSPPDDDEFPGVGEPIGDPFDLWNGAKGQVYRVFG